MGSEDNRLYAFTSDGALVWSYYDPWYLFWAIGSDGGPYIGSMDNTLYSFKADIATPTSPLPPHIDPNPD